jgi:hypothetical protein
VGRFFGSKKEKQELIEEQSVLASEVVQFFRGDVDFRRSSAPVISSCSSLIVKNNYLPGDPVSSVLSVKRLSDKSEWLTPSLKGEKPR